MCLTSAISDSYCLVDNILSHCGQIYTGFIVNINNGNFSWKKQIAVSSWSFLGWLKHADKTLYQYHYNKNVKHQISKLQTIQQDHIYIVSRVYLFINYVLLFQSLRYPSTTDPTLIDSNHVSLTFK